MSDFDWAQILTTSMLTGTLFVSTTGCQQLPGTPGQQGAAIGGAGGAATGAAVAGENHRLVGAVIGGLVGAGGGYLIGANKDRILGRDTTGAQAAVRNAQEHPATPQQALNAPTADLNGDGFVTMDEVVAMRQAGFSDQQMLDRIRATGQVFELTPSQEAYLRNNGVDQYVIDQLPQVNGGVPNGAMAQPTQPPPTGAPIYQQPPTYYPPPQTPPPAQVNPVPSAPPAQVNPYLNNPVPPPPSQ